MFRKLIIWSLSVWAIYVVYDHTMNFDYATCINETNMCSERADDKYRACLNTNNPNCHDLHWLDQEKCADEDQKCVPRRIR